MARKRLENRHIRKIQKTRSTYMVSLPVEIVRKFKWRERQKVEVTEYGKNKILIKDWPSTIKTKSNKKKKK